jgi:predicted transcriptional regulator
LANTLLDILMPPPEPVAASDGTLYRTAGAAFLHDLIERKWSELLPTLQSPEVIRDTREQLRVSQTELAQESGISQSLLAMLETGHRRMTEGNVWKIWSALWRLNQARRKEPAAIELLIRLDGDLAMVTEMRREIL